MSYSYKDWSCKSAYVGLHKAIFNQKSIDLNYLIELESTQWATDLKNLFKKALELKRKNPQYDKDDKQIFGIETEMDELLSTQLKEKTPKTVIFQNSMIDYRKYLFPFLYDKNIPADNNGSERGIRNIKVKMKISGQFKTGHETFAKLRSIIDTCIKKDLPVLHIMQQIATLN